MKKEASIYLILLSGLLFTFCSKSGQPATLDGLQRMQQAIRQQAAGTEPDTALMRRFLEQADSSLSGYDQPPDTAAQKLLFMAADIARGFGEYQRAIHLWERTRQINTQNTLGTEALFLQGFTAEQDLRQPQRAKGYYQKFLEDYPQHPLRKDVALLLQYLEEQRSDEDLIREFQQNQPEEGIVQ